MTYKGSQFVSGDNKGLEERELTIRDSQKRYNLISNNDNWYQYQRKSLRDKGESPRKFGKEFLPLEEIEIEGVEE
jgi:hypothetical protein